MRGSYVIQTGQNKVWRAEIRFKTGLIQYGRGRGNLLGPPVRKIPEMVDVLKSEIVVREKEGIQPDWSFHRHGVQLQFGNYALSYAATQAKWAWILRDTPFEYSKDQIGILRNFFLQGLSRVVWKGRMDISGLGRQIKPENQEERAGLLLDVLRMMKKVDPSYADEYRAVIDFNIESHSAKPAIVGNYYFWRSAMMTHRSTDHYISIRMCSQKIQSTESGNGENLLAAHLSDGATYLYKTGKEYQNIFPVWNWHRIPGTTAYAKGDLPEVSWDGLRNGSDFVGGLSYENFGISTMLFQRNDLKVHKSWFFVPDGMVCLGTGITSKKEKTVATTLDQRLLDGPVVVKRNGKVMTVVPGQNMESQDIEWVYHDGTGYVFLQKGSVHAGATLPSGDWQRIYENGSPESVRKEVFDLWVDHGKTPQNKSYAYMILPAIGDEYQLTHKVNNPSIEVLQNTSSIQAVHDIENGLIQAVFYEAGTLHFEDNTYLRVNSPCIVLMNPEESGTNITVSVPPELPGKVVLRLSGQYYGEQAVFDPQQKETSITFDLLDGMYAGQSLTKTVIQ